MISELEKVKINLEIRWIHQKPNFRHLIINRIIFANRWYLTIARYYDSHMGHYLRLFKI